MAERDAVPRSLGAGLLLYGIGDTSSAWPSDERGVQGGGLRRIAHGGLTALVSPLVERARVATPVRVDLLDYERVIRAWHAVADVLPMRFGSVLSDEAEVRAHLDEQRAPYLRVLTRISGCVEMGVRALVSAPPPAPEPEEAVKPEVRSGADYLRARRHRHAVENRLRDRCTVLEQTLLSKVGPLCREHQVEFSPSRSGGPALYSLYFLVPRGQVSAFRAALSPMPVTGLAELTLSGPWPPFNFVAPGHTTC